MRFHMHDKEGRLHKAVEIVKRGLRIVPPDTEIFRHAAALGLRELVKGTPDEAEVASILEGM
jgi:hypothetical protein